MVVVVMVPVIMVVAMIVRGVVHRNVPVIQRVRDARWARRETGLAMTFKGTAHEHVQPVLLRVQNDGKWNVCVAPQMNVMRIRDVVDDEVAGVERLASLVFLVVRIRLLSQHGTPKCQKACQKEE